MSNELTVLDQALARLNQTGPGESTSLDDIINGEKRSILAVDISGSMTSVVKRTGLRAIDEMRKVVDVLLETHPVPVMAFGFHKFDGGPSVRMVERVPDEPQGFTPLATAIKMARDQGATHLVVISDGQPTTEGGSLNEKETLDAARAFEGPIDVFYIGDAGDKGEAFMRKLAQLTGGRCDTTDLNTVGTKQLTGKIVALLGDGGRSTSGRGPIIL
jgi:hypothetical protein